VAFYEAGIHSIAKESFATRAAFAPDFPMFHKKLTQIEQKQNGIVTPLLPELAFVSCSFRPPLSPHFQITNRTDIQISSSPISDPALTWICFVF
jgi:hypothetical protein